MGFEFDLCQVFQKEQTRNTTFLKLNLCLPADEFMKAFIRFGPSQRANISKLFHLCM